MSFLSRNWLLALEDCATSTRAAGGKEDLEGGYQEVTIMLQFRIVYGPGTKMKHLGGVLAGKYYTDICQPACPDLLECEFIQPFLVSLNKCRCWNVLLLHASRSFFQLTSGQAWPYLCFQEDNYFKRRVVRF